MESPPGGVPYLVSLSSERPSASSERGHGLRRRAVTVSVAAADSVTPTALVKTARNTRPLIAVVSFFRGRAILVAPRMAVNVSRRRCSTCHWTLTPVPVAAAVNVTDCPARAVTSAGEAVIAGGSVTVRVAGADGTVRVPVVTLARNKWPESPAVATNVYVTPVAPSNGRPRAAPVRADLPRNRGRGGLRLGGQGHRRTRADRDRPLPGQGHGVVHGQRGRGGRGVSGPAAEHRPVQGPVQGRRHVLDAQGRPGRPGDCWRTSPLRRCSPATAQPAGCCPSPRSRTWPSAPSGPSATPAPSG